MVADEPITEPRTRLTRDRIVLTAMTQADGGGIEALSMRTLAEALGVAPMALYRHVSNKEDLIDGMVDVVFTEIGLPAGGTDWKRAMRQRAFSLRDVLARHRWAIGLMESRTNPGPATLRHHDAVLGSLRAGGFSVVMTAHAYSLLDSYIYGFALTTMNLPFDGTDEAADVSEAMLAPFPAGEYPNLVEFLDEHVRNPGYSYGDEFAYGLDLILEQLEEVRQTASPTR
jgi:AcrR family transcriptional regulator